MRNRLRLTRAAGAVAALALALTACGTSSSDSGDGKPAVVASTDVYGAIATAVAGGDATVTSLFANPTGDPHEFEPSAQDTLKVKKAAVLVFNGGHYDAYIEQAAEGAAAAKIDAVALQDPKGENEHVFYDLPTMQKVATAVAKALAEKDAAHREGYESRAAAFSTKLDTVIGQARAIGHANPGAKIAATEPVAGYLLTLAGLTDAAPARYTAAIESGTDPAPADIAAANALVSSQQVRAVVLNAQTESPVTAALAKTAETAGVPVVKVTESLPAGVDDYIAWQASNVKALSDALAPRP
ncbi:metal ABC transporter solute-binding protein, Zn/Mn family [Tsukamurella ocularis]|uniref:metal ABC transporter solute-binding protein, Zn/Mn family n=1 Tax=Tsukamurella ocularis TaxID=1970234 RepID=UPI002169FF67|nr:zinc ABC transporter substrate-binding protein [Tsukamurella ocularis]MCS3781248.1 zinc/manganese transport system substrate-binding protein [Tsukamurella ocularis]MCS3787619.1 zinc/manganese transport system substrate-binding protein [Tsukamurella ocularis]MCS3850914.1 zinc/manganese transport system substrate-binding protein [Tsukamurella ocularis]